LLWNIFRQFDSCTSYYEPLNERRWFNSSTRGDKTDSTHLGVDDYWSEFTGMDDLNDIYDEDWIRHRLLMDEHSWDPLLSRYIDSLIERASGTPVLQFNRIDFRLAWLRHNYPSAKLIHLYRHPRDQWLSFLTDKELMNKDVVESTYRDAFYLDTWCNDLSKYFPFLSTEQTPHPYQRFYYLWKLSYLQGKQYSDISVSFEELVTDPRSTLERVFNVTGMKEIAPWDKIERILRKPKLGKWKTYADSDWFENHESVCETVLANYLN
jgi:hypothetical protein